ncbi:MAG: glycerate kinase [Candidatus Eremiobacteraeota bacterium]|nr:glycerate kinase [Candidatus Eremiobacteraeota bacterium]
MPEKNIIEKLRNDALSIYRGAVEKMIPHRAIWENLKIEGDLILFGKKGTPTCIEINYKKLRKIFIFGIGKAGYVMAGSALDSLKEIKEMIAGGLVITKDGHAGEKDLHPLIVKEASHPVPDERSLESTGEIIDILRNAGEDDLVLFLISGGGSALYESLYPGMTIDDLKMITNTLLKCGADIEEINTIRKHISMVKGGKTAELAYPARVVSLILSDVLGSPLESIASGPTVADTGTFEDVMKIIEKYKIKDEIPQLIYDFILRGVSGDILETIKAGNPCLAKSSSVVIGDNIAMTRQAKIIAEKLGYNTMILTNWIRGEARHIGDFFTSIARHVESGDDFPVSAPCCVIASGEPVVTIRGKGKGGRCQEAAISFTASSGELSRSLFLAAGSDGTDGPTDAAGGIGSNLALLFRPPHDLGRGWSPDQPGNGMKSELRSPSCRNEQKDLDIHEYLDNNNSYEYLKLTGDLIITGPTGTNVNDLFVLMVG